MPSQFPPRHQDRQPGRQKEMEPTPETASDQYRPAGKLQGKRALITGGDSEIGRSVAVLFAREGADIAFTCFDEGDDARDTFRAIQAEGRRAVVMCGDIGTPSFCAAMVERTVRRLEGIDILVNNAGEQHETGSLTEITDEQ